MTLSPLFASTNYSTLFRAHYAKHILLIIKFINMGLHLARTQSIEPITRPRFRTFTFNALSDVTTCTDTVFIVAFTGRLFAINILAMQFFASLCTRVVK